MSDDEFLKELFTEIVTKPEPRRLRTTWQTVESRIQKRECYDGMTYWRVRFLRRTYPVFSLAEARALLAFLREFRRDASTENVLGHPVIHLT